MNTLTDDLAGLAGAIVRGEEPSPQIAARYANYSCAVAIEVYRNNYRGNLQDALTGAYPVIVQLVGTDFFRHMARQYIGQHPSHSGNLHHYGAGMADFVASFAPAQGLPYLADVAALEWACHCAWFADDAAALDLARLAQVPPANYPDLILHTHPACHLVRSRYPLAAIWHAHQPGAPADFHLDLDSGLCNALVSRRDDVVHVSELPVADAEWLQGIQDALTLGEATALTLASQPDFDLQAALQNLVAQAVLSGFSIKPAS